MKKIATGFAMMGLACLIILFVTLATWKLPLLPKGPVLPWVLLWAGLGLTVAGLALYSHAEDSEKPKPKRRAN